VKLKDVLPVRAKDKMKKVARKVEENKSWRQFERKMKK